VSGEHRMTTIEKLKAWLKDESRIRYGGAGTHVLRLWDWEIKALLKEFEENERTKSQSDKKEE